MSSSSLTLPASCWLPGKFFTFDLLDQQGGEIRAIAFGPQADAFEPLVKMGAILQISKASLKPKKNNVRTPNEPSSLILNCSNLKFTPTDIKAVQGLSMRL